MSFGENLKKVMGSMKIRDLHLGSGVPESSLRKYLRGDAEPVLSTAVAIADFLGLSLDRLTKGSGGQGLALAIPYIDENCFSSSQLTLHKGCAQTASLFLYPPSFLESISHQHYSTLRTLIVEGDSMGATLKHGALLLIELAEEGGIPLEGIYAVRLSVGIVLRRIQGLDENTIRLSADNEAYASLSMDISKFSFGETDVSGSTIIGRVIWVSNQI